MAPPLPSLSSPPPWEVLLLVAERLDPKTLATASCVCKFWSISMASDHLWEPIFTANFPSLSNLAISSSAPTSPPVSFRRLFGLGHTAAARRRPAPSKPTLSLSDLIFVISISSTDKDRYIVGHELVEKDKAPPQSILTVVKHGGELAVDRNGLFKFDINLDGDNGNKGGPVVIGGREEVEVVWNLVLEGWRGVFTMIECGGRVGMAPRADGWFSEELPAAGCCSNVVSGGIVADLKLGLRGNNGGGSKVRIESVSVGMMSIVSWRYVSLDDGLMYLQHFLFNASV
ncbi:probable F-box protein At5g04010 [Benincasa hispida]|uniref:probable F-box protein At5g04010 n=1 Tax=Benincasa hispida TaxID=102211 RepID=UPI00190023E0|nr:probable F-box protein At5g04010 [Benincasa hispida]